MSERARPVITSPCTDVCASTPERLVRGCLRTIDEIAAWAALDERDRRGSRGAAAAARCGDTRTRRRGSGMKPIDFYFDRLALRVPGVRAPAAGARGPVGRASATGRYVRRPAEHWGPKGPAEIEPKRAWTFRQVAWLAHEHGVAIDRRRSIRSTRWPCCASRWPARRPAARPAGAAASWSSACLARRRRRRTIRGGSRRCGELAPRAIRRATRSSRSCATRPRGAARGIFGVPTIEVDGRLFWGFDALDGRRLPARRRLVRCAARQWEGAPGPACSARDRAALAQIALRGASGFTQGWISPCFRRQPEKSSIVALPSPQGDSFQNTEGCNMVTTAAPVGAKVSRPMTARGEEGHLRLLARHGLRVVRLLSLRLAGRHHRRAVLLRRSTRSNALHLRAAGLRRRLPGAPVRRAGVRPPRRPGRPQVHLPRHHPDHGPVDLPRRPAARLRHDRHRRAGHPDRAAHAAGPGARRRIRRRGDLRRRARAARPARLLHALDPDHRDARPVPVADRHPRHCAAWLGEAAFAAWGWRIPFLVSIVLLASRSGSGCS